MDDAAKFVCQRGSFLGQPNGQVWFPHVNIYFAKDDERIELRFPIVRLAGFHQRFTAQLECVIQFVAQPIHAGQVLLRTANDVGVTELLTSRETTLKTVLRFLKSMTAGFHNSQEIEHPCMTERVAKPM